MARRQTQIPGTEVAGTTDASVDPEIEEATDDLCKVRSERKREIKRLSDLEKQKEIELVTVLRTKNIPIYSFFDDEDEEVEVELQQTWKVNVRKTGEVKSDVGDGIPSSDAEATPGVHPGLIAQAEKAQADAGVAVDSEGDVVTPDVAAPKKGRKTKAKRAEADAS